MGSRLCRDISLSGGSHAIDVTGFVSGSTEVNLGADSRWAGVSGSTVYTVGGIVTALKRVGILAY